MRGCVPSRMRKTNKKTRYDIILLFVTGVALMSSSVINSCAGKSVEGDDALNELQTSDQVPPPAPEGTDSLGALGDLSTQTPPPTESELSPLPQENLGDATPPPPPPSDQPTGDLLADTQTPPPTDAVGDLSTTDAGPALQPVGDLSPASTGGTSAGNWSGRSSAPVIPAEAVQRGGKLLNRYYFVRKGQNAGAVSRLLYGTPARAKELSRWNRGAFAPGKLVLYSSPRDASDRQMRSYYEENGAQPEQYVVRKGDWLSRIAEKKLGSVRSWKEIAATNGLASPDAIETGQRLNLYGGAEGGAFAEPPVVAQNEAPQPRRPREEPPPVQPPPRLETPPTQLGEPPVLQAEGQPQDGTPPPPMDEAPKKKKKASGGFDLGRIIEQNLFFIVVGAGISALLLALLAVSKKRKERQASLAEDDEGFASGRAKRR